MKSKKGHFINRATCGFLVLIFTCHTVLFEPIALGALSLSQKSEVKIASQNEFPFNIPSELASIEETSDASALNSKPFVLHIQDIHANPGAQRQVYQLLKSLGVQHKTQAKGELLVGLEGAKGRLFPRYFHFFNSLPKVNNIIVEDLFEKGEVSGAELLAWEESRSKKKLPLSFYGVENVDLYRENLKIYQGLFAEKSVIEEKLKIIFSYVESLRSKVLSEAARDFLKERKRRKEGKYEGREATPQLLSYIPYLSKQANDVLQINLEDAIEQVRFPQMTRFLTIAQIEKKINHEVAEEERTEVFSHLRKKVKSKQGKLLLNKIENLQPGTPHLRRTLEDFWELAEHNQINLLSFSEFLKKMGILILNSELEAEALFLEMERLESWIMEKLAVTKEEQSFVRFLDHSDLLEQLLKLELNRKSWKKINAIPFRVKPSRLLNELTSFNRLEISKQITENFESLTSIYERALQFYEVAEARDRALLDHLFEEAKGPYAILISGGFHSQGLTDLMKAQGVGYAVLRPTMKELEDLHLAEKVFLDENANVASYLEDASLTKQEKLFFKGIMETGVSALSDEGMPLNKIAQAVAQAVNEHDVLSRKLRFEAADADLPLLMKFKIDFQSPPLVSPMPPTVSSQGVAMAHLLQQAEQYEKSKPALGKSFADFLTQILIGVRVRGDVPVVVSRVMVRKTSPSRSSSRPLLPRSELLSSKSEGRSSVSVAADSNSVISDLLDRIGFEAVSDPKEQERLSNTFLSPSQALISYDSSFITGMPDLLYDYNQNVLPQLNQVYDRETSAALNLLLGYVGLERGRVPVKEEVLKFFKEEVLILQGMLRGRRPEGGHLLLRAPYVDPEMMKVSSGWRSVEGNPSKEENYLKNRVEALSDIFSDPEDRQRVQALLSNLLPGAKRFFHYTSSYGDTTESANASKTHHELDSIIRGIQEARSNNNTKKLEAPVVIFTQFESGKIYIDNYKNTINIHDQNLAYLHKMQEDGKIDFYDFQDPAAPQFQDSSNDSGIVFVNLPGIPSQLFNEFYISSHFAVVAGDMGLRYLFYLALLGTGPLTLLFPHLNGQEDLYDQFAEILQEKKFGPISVAETKDGREMLEVLKNFFDIQNPQRHLESKRYADFSARFAKLLLNPELRIQYRNAMAHFMDGRFNMYGYILKILEHVSRNPSFVQEGLKREKPQSAIESFAAEIIRLQPDGDFKIPKVDLRNLTPVFVLKEFITGKGDPVFLMQLLSVLKSSGFDYRKKAFVLLGDTVEEELLEALVNYETVARGTSLSVDKITFVRIEKDENAIPKLKFFRFPEGKSIREAIRSAKSQSESRLQQRRSEVVQVGDDYVSLDQTGLFSMVATRAFKDEDTGEYRTIDKRQAMLDLLGYDKEAGKYKSVDPTKENVVFVGAHNSFVKDRGATIPTIEGVQGIAVDKNQNAVYQGSEANIQRVSDLTGFRQGEHGQSATKKLLQMYQEGHLPLPKVLALGLNDVLIDFVEVKDGESHRSHIEEDALDIIVDLMAQGVQIAFITDEMEGAVKDNLGVLLFHRIKSRMATDSEFRKKERKVAFYTSHGVSKFMLTVKDPGQKRIIYKNDEDYVGNQHRLTPELEEIVIRSFGYAREVESKDISSDNGLVEGDMQLVGPLGNYYDRTTEQALFGSDTRHTTLNDRVKGKYGAFTRPQTSELNIEGVEPEIVSSSEKGSIVRVAPVMSREASGATILDGEADERDIVLDDTIKTLKKEHEKIEQNKEEPKKIEWTALDPVVDLVKARDARYEELASLERELTVEFNEISKKYFAQAALDDNGEPTDDLKHIRGKFDEGFEKMTLLARRAYDIAKEALKANKEAEEKKKEGDAPSSSDSWQLVKALKFFGAARRFRRLTREAYLNAIRGTSSAPSEREMPDLPVEQDEYISSLDDDWRNAINSYQSKYDPWQFAIENILYDLRVSDQDILSGASESGRAFDSLYEIANALLTLILMHGENSPEFVERAQAAKFLELIFQEQVYNGVANNSMDDLAGATVPLETYSKSRGGSLKDLEDTLLLPFATFSNPFSQKEHVIASGEDKHSRTAPHWIAEAAGAIANYYMNRNREDALEVAAQKRMPEVAKQREIFLNPEYHTQKDDKIVYSYEGMKRAFEENKNKTFDHNGEELRVFRQAALRKGGKIIQIPPRGELMADSVRDPTDVLTLEGDQMSILQASVELTLEDGTIGRNINIAVQVKDQEKMKPDKDGNKPVIRVHSADMVWTLDFHDARDVMKKTDATLVLDTLVSLGIIPRELMLAAIEDGQEVEALKLIMDHLFGSGKSLEVYMHVDNIQGGSGVSVSNLLAVGMSLLMDASMGTAAADVGYEDVLQLEVPVAQEQQKRTKSGWYAVEVSTTPDFEAPYQFKTKLPQGSDTLHLQIRGTELESGQDYYVRTHYVESESFLKRTVSEEDWVYYQNGFVVTKNEDEGVFQVEAKETECDSACSVIDLKPIKHLWEYHDSKEHVQRAAMASQTTGLYLNMKGGIQDDSAAKAGKMRLVVSEGPVEGYVSTDEYGNPLPIGQQRRVRLRSGITPEYHDVILPPAAEAAFNQQTFLGRVGLTEKADDSLAQWTGTHYTNANEEGNMVWRKFSDLTLASVVTLHDPKSSLEFGKYGQAAIPLRQKLGDVAVTPFIVEALAEWSKANSRIANKVEVAFNFIQTGARISGSVFLKFPPDVSLEEEKRVKQDIQRRLEEKIASLGKLAPVEEAPVIYSVRIVRDGRGARLRTLDEGEFEDWKARHWDAVQVAKKAQQQRSRAERPLHSRKDVQNYKEQFDFQERDETLETGRVSSESDVETVLTTEPSVRADIQKAQSDLQALNGKSALLTYEQKQEIAEKRFERENLPFHTSVSIEAFREIADRLEKNTTKLRKVLDRTSPEALRALFTAIRQGHIDFLVDYAVEDLVQLANLFLPPQDLNSGLKIVTILSKYEEERAQVYEVLGSLKQKHESMSRSDSLDIVRFQDSAFWNELGQNIKDLENEIKDYVERSPEDPSYNLVAVQEHQEKVEFLKALKAAPSPEYLPDDHPLFKSRYTTAYHRIKEKRDLLERVVLSGGLVLYVRQGGAGARWGGGDRVKSAVRWWYAGSSDSFSGQKTRMIWDFFKRYSPVDEEGLPIDEEDTEALDAFFKQIGLHGYLNSAITHDANERVRREETPKSGLGDGSVTVQSMRRVYHLTPDEVDSLLDEEIPKAKDDKARAALKRRYEEMKEYAQQQLEIAKKHGLVSPDAIRAPYVDGGILDDDEEALKAELIEVGDITNEVSKEEVAEKIKEYRLQGKGLNPMANYAPSGTAGELEGLIVGAVPQKKKKEEEIDDQKDEKKDDLTLSGQSKQRWTRQNLLDLGFKLNRLARFVPEEELENGMPLAKAALIVESDRLDGASPLSVIYAMNHSSMAQFNPGAIAEATHRIVKKGDFMVAEVVNMVGAGEKGGVFTNKWFLNARDVNELKKKIAYPDNGQINYFVNLVKTSEEKADPKATVKMNEIILRHLIHQGLITEDDADYVRSRFLKREYEEFSPTAFMEALVNKTIPTTHEGRRAKYMERGFLRHVAMASGNAVFSTRQLWKISGYDGNETSEDEAIEAFLKSDYKERRERFNHVMNHMMTNTYSVKWRKEILPGGEIKEWPIIQRETVTMSSIEFFVKFGLNVSFLERDSRFFADAKDPAYLLSLLLRQDTYDNGASIRNPEIKLSENRARVLQELNQALGGVRLSDAERDGLPPRIIERMKKRQKQLWSGQSPKEAQSESRISTNSSMSIKDIEKALLEELHQLNDDFRNFEGDEKPVSLMSYDEIRSRRSKLATLLKRVDELEVRYRKNQDEHDVTPSREVIQRYRFLSDELEALWVQAQFYGMRKENTEIPLFPIGPTWIKILTDKDATLREPSTPVTYKKAQELIDLLRDGVQLRILTGSTPFEAWRDIMVPIIKELTTGGRSHLSRFEKQVIFARLKILANDGTSVVTVNASDPNHFKPNRLRHARRWENGKWVPFATTKRVFYDEEKKVVKEDKRVRAKVATISAQEFLKRIFVGEGQDLERITQNFFSGISNNKSLSEQKKEFATFVDNVLEVNPLDDDLLKDFIGKDDPELMEKGDPQAWHDSHVSMLKLVEHMLNYASEGSKLNQGNIAYYKRLKDLIEKNKVIVQAKINGKSVIRYERKKLLEVESFKEPTNPKGDWSVKVKTNSGIVDRGISGDQFVELIRGDSNYSEDEEIVATLLTLHYKESDWTFGSVSADKMNKVQKEGDSRTDKVATILVHDKKWWDGLAQSIYQKVMDAKLVGMTDDGVDLLMQAAQEGRYEDAKVMSQAIQAQTVIWELSQVEKRADFQGFKWPDQKRLVHPILWGSRGGSGYFNAVAGSSKVEYLDGQTQTPDTYLTSPIMIGDSKTDQGRFPPKQSVDLSYDFLRAIQEGGKKIPKSLRDKIKIYEIRPSEIWYYEDKDFELSEEERSKAYAQISIIALDVHQLRARKTRFRNPTPQQKELMEWLEANENKIEEIIETVMDNSKDTDDVNWFIAKAFLKEGYQKRHKLRIEFIGRMTDDDYLDLSSLIEANSSDATSSYLSGLSAELRKSMKSFFDYLKGPFSERNVLRVLLASIKEMNPEERERMERNGLQFQRNVKFGRRQMDDMTRLTTHYWEQMGPAFVYDFFRAFVNYAKRQNREGIYFLDARDPEEALNIVLLGIIEELNEIQPKAVGLFVPTSMRDLDVDMEGKAEEELVAFPIPKVIQEDVAASEVRAETAQIEDILLRRNSSRQLREQFLGSDGMRLLEDTPGFSQKTARLIRNVGRHTSEGIYSIVDLKERYQEELAVSDSQALDYAYTFAIKESLRGASVSKAPELTVAEAKALKVNGEDLEKRYFTTRQTTPLKKKHVLVENLEGLPDLRNFASEIPWIRYLSKHSNVIWSLDLDGVTAEEARQFLKDLLDQVEAWGYGLETGQIIVRGSRVQGIDPENARMPLNKNRIHAYVASEREAFSAVPFRRDIEFRAILSEEVSEKIAERILAADALQVGFDGDRYGIISGKDLVDNDADYQDLVAGIQAFIRISSAA